MPTSWERARRASHGHNCTPAIACVNPECQRFCLTGQDNLTVRKVYGHDRIRLLRCRTCGEECSERRGTALFKTKRAEDNAEFMSNHLDVGGGVRSPACLSNVSEDTVARRLRIAGHIEQALTQAARYRARRHYNLATSGEERARRGTEEEQ